MGRATANVLGRESWLTRKLRPSYEMLLRVCSFGRGISWTINGVPFRVDPSCRHRLGVNYDEPVAQFLRERVKPGDLCFDVGANVGVYVLQFAYWAGPDGRVVAFEPNPAALYFLRKHIQLNGLDDRVEVVEAAVGAEPGETVFYVAGSSGMGRVGTPNKSLTQTEEIKVPFLTLDDYCFSKGLIPDWLFIDIEGFEIAALVGASRLLEKHLDKVNIVVEMHPNVWDSSGTSREHAQSLLEQWGLRPVPLSGQQDPLADHGLVYLEPAQ